MYFYRVLYSYILVYSIEVHNRNALVYDTLCIYKVLCTSIEYFASREYYVLRVYNAVYETLL